MRIPHDALILTMNTRTLRRDLPSLPRIALLLLGSVYALWLTACAPPTAQMTFFVEGVAPSGGGGFTNRFDFRIEPTNLRIVLGDLHFRQNDPAQNLEAFESFPPLIPPGQIVQPEDIGKNGAFPGMSVINLLPGAGNTENILPQGRMPANTWREMRLRFGPAVVGTRGVTAQDALFQRTILFEGTAQKGASIRCDLIVQVAFSLGVSLRISPFAVQANASHTSRIQIDYAKWFEDIQFEPVCAGASGPVLINDTQNKALFDQIRNAIPATIRFAPGAAQ